MIYLLYGADTYRSRDKAEEIIQAFRERAGDALAVTHVDAEEDSPAIFNIGKTASLFSEKELVLVENISHGTVEAGQYVVENIERWGEDRALILVFRERECDTKNRVLAAILQCATKAQEFKLLAPVALARWVDAAIHERGTQLPPAEKTAIIARCGADLWAISNEIDKAASGWKQEYTRTSDEAVWGVTDAFFRSRRAAFPPLERMLRAGHEAPYLLGALASALRTVALVWRGIRTNTLRRTTAGIHPYVVKKQIDVAKHLDAGTLRGRFAELVETDISLKTGFPPAPLPLIRLVLGKKEPTHRPR